MTTAEIIAELESALAETKNLTPPRHASWDEWEATLTAAIAALQQAQRQRDALEQKVQEVEAEWEELTDAYPGGPNYSQQDRERWARADHPEASARVTAWRQARAALTPAEEAPNDTH